MPLACNWSIEAENDIDSIQQLIARDNPKASFEVVIQIVEKTEAQLSQYPFLGRKGRNPETRELILKNLPYVIAYRIVNESIEVLRVLHSAQKWPDDF